MYFVSNGYIPNAGFVNGDDINLEKDIKRATSNSL